QRGAFLHFLDRAADLFLLVPLGEITEADDADRLAALIADENARDLPVLHQLRDLVHVLVGPHARHVLRHRLFHARTLEISALGDEPDYDVAIRDRADRLPGRIDDWQESDVFIGHQTSDLLNARLAADGPHVLLHEILHAHCRLPFRWYAAEDAHLQARASAACRPLLARRNHARPDGAADDDRRLEHGGGGVGQPGSRRAHLPRPEAQLAARLAHGDDLAFHLDEISRVQRREELDR